MTEFRECMLDLGLTDLRSTGEFFTWWTKSLQDPIYRKLDRLLVNGHWMDLFPEASCNFLPRGLSYYSPVISKSGIRLISKKKTVSIFSLFGKDSIF